MKTIETGAGASTIVFAMKGTSHTCIVPDASQVERIRHYCSDHGISDVGLTFIVERSEMALPQITDEVFDLALIDGWHAFPSIY